MVAVAAVPPPGGAAAVLDHLRVDAHRDDRRRDAGAAHRGRRRRPAAGRRDHRRPRAAQRPHGRGRRGDVHPDRVGALARRLLRARGPGVPRPDRWRRLRGRHDHLHRAGAPCLLRRIRRDRRQDDRHQRAALGGGTVRREHRPDLPKTPGRDDRVRPHRRLLQRARHPHPRRPRPYRPGRRQHEVHGRPVPRRPAVRPERPGAGLRRRAPVLLRPHLGRQLRQGRPDPRPRRPFADDRQRRGDAHGGRPLQPLGVLGGLRRPRGAAAVRAGHRPGAARRGGADGPRRSSASSSCSSRWGWGRCTCRWASTTSSPSGW